VAGAAQKTGPAFAGLRFLGIAAALAPLPANAGAWIAPEGGQKIWTSFAGESEGFTFVELSGYVEAPAARDTSVVVSTWMQRNADPAEVWRGEATLAAKHVVYRSGRGAIVALQAGALWNSRPQEGCSEGGAEVRALLGRGIGRTGFVNVEAATRALEGGCESERLDLTVGYRPGENWLAMGQLLLEAPREGDEILRAQVTLVNFRPSGRGIQVGLRTRVDGGAQETALVVGLWGRPGG